MEKVKHLIGMILKRLVHFRLLKIFVLLTIQLSLTRSELESFISFFEWHETWMGMMKNPACCYDDGGNVVEQ